MIKTQCPACDEIIKADFKQRGQMGKCPHCGAKFAIEAVPWWTGVGKKARAVQTAKAKESPSEPAAHSLRRSRRKVRGPYEPVDVPDAPVHTGPGWMAYVVIGCLALVIVVAAVGLLAGKEEEPAPEPKPKPAPILFTRPPGRDGTFEDSNPPETPETPETPATTEEEPSPEPEPEPEPEPPREEAPPAPTTAQFKVPYFAEALKARIVAAGFSPTQGFSLPNGRGFRIRISEDTPVFFAMYTRKGRVIEDGFVQQVESGAGADMNATRIAMGNVLGALLAEDQRKTFSQWVGVALREARRAGASDRRYLRERRFGDKVVRCEAAELPGIGPGTSVQIGRDYKPSTEDRTQRPVRDWPQMRIGVTLAEVEAFARKGRLRSRIGTDDWPIETYVWPHGGQVIFQNGRATQWRAPKPPPPPPPEPNP